MRVKCYCYESGWSPITASWTTVPNSKTGPLLSYNDISYSNGLNQVINHRYRFNIKDAVTKWVEALLPDNTCIPNSFSRDTGVLFRTTLPTEASSTEIYKTFASFNRSEYRPSATITYSTSIIKNQYYSKYDPQKFNTGNGLQPIGDGSHAITRDIMYRMNCYGYAFRHIYDNDDNSGYFTILNPANPLGYEQHPGSFALEADMQNVYNVSELTEYTEPETTMFRVENNMLKDATRLGYSLTVYPINGNTNEVDQYGSTSRLIAVVTSNDNYHFYMQHNDGTWSHKLGGDDDVTNLSISTNRVLTNNNIISKAKEANYENGCLKFFVITRPAIIDYPHGYASDGNQVATYYREKAGEYLIDSRTISSSISGKIDFLKDEDCFAFIPELTKKYEIEVSATSVVSISFSIKSETGTILASGNTSNSISITLNANTQYFIYLKGNNGLEYASYSLQIA